MNRIAPVYCRARLNNYLPFSDRVKDRSADILLYSLNKAAVLITSRLDKLRL
jgi:hypothetical protein